MVPTKEAKTTTLNKAIETISTSFWSPFKRRFMPSTISESKKPFSKATRKTLLSRFKSPSSTKPGLAKLCTTRDDDWIPTLPPVACISGIKKAMAVMRASSASKMPMNWALSIPPIIPINSHGKRARVFLHTLSSSSTSSLIPDMIWRSSSACSVITSITSSIVMRPTNCPWTFTTGTDSKS